MNLDPTPADFELDLAACLSQFETRQGYPWALWICSAAETLIPAAIRRALYGEEQQAALLGEIHHLRAAVRELLEAEESWRASNEAGRMRSADMRLARAAAKAREVMGR